MALFSAVSSMTVAGFRRFPLDPSTLDGFALPRGTTGRLCGQPIPKESAHTVPFLRESLHQLKERDP